MAPEGGRFLYQWSNPDHPFCIHFFVAPFEGDRNQLVLHEGQDLRWFSIETMVQESKMAPHVPLHVHRSSETNARLEKSFQVPRNKLLQQSSV